MNSVKPLPTHWYGPGRPSYPDVWTDDFCEFPDGYGYGSGTVLEWIEENMELDKLMSEGAKLGKSY